MTRHWTMLTGRAAILAAALLFACLPVNAAWPPDPGANLAVADSAGAHSQPKFAMTGDGGCYISWFQNSGTGYDVHLQRLTADGGEDWPHNGILVESRPYSSTQDYGIASDAEGNAVIAYRGQRAGVDQIIVQLVSASGQLLWGAGAQVSSNPGSAFIGSPDVTVASDGGYLVGWLQDDASYVQRLEPDGAPSWPLPVALQDPQGTRWIWLRRLIAAEDGTVIAVLVRSGQMWEPRHLLLQKISAAGALLWGPDHVTVLDGGSLQVAYAPPAVSDGAGGVVLAWYTVDASLQCWVQRVLADGTEVFPHNGAALADLPGQQRVSPWPAFNPAASELFAVWIETDMLQSWTGVRAQKLDAAGVRQWGDTGVEILPLMQRFHLFPMAWPCAGGVFLTYFEQPQPAVDEINGARLDGNGAHVWPGPLVAISTAQSQKFHPASGLNSHGQLLLAWADSRSSAPGIYAQNVNPDGSLGPLVTPTPTPAPSTSPEPTATAAPTSTPLPTEPPSPTATAEPTAPPTEPPPTATASPAPTATPSPPPPTATATVAPTATDLPSPTATPSCGALGCSIWMPAAMFRPGDPCLCRLTVCNPTAQTYANVPVFALLDVFGVYFFAPSFTEYGHYTLDIEPGEQEITVVPQFDWPTGAGAADNIVWHAAMTDGGVTELFGEYGSFTFGWTE